MRGRQLATVIVCVLTEWVMLGCNFENELREHKSARETTGIIVAKKEVQFDANQTSYQDAEGRTIPLDAWRRKTPELRVYYKIDNFDQIPERHRKALATAEQDRFKKFGPRYTIVNQKDYDAAEIRQSVVVTYAWLNDWQIELIGVELQNQKNSRSP